MFEFIDGFVCFICNYTLKFKGSYGKLMYSLRNESENHFKICSNGLMMMYDKYNDDVIHVLLYCHICNRYCHLITD